MLTADSHTLLPVATGLVVTSRAAVIAEEQGVPTSQARIRGATAGIAMPPFPSCESVDRTATPYIREVGIHRRGDDIRSR